MKLLAHGVTHVGRKRKHNEDALLIDDSVGLYVVADGVGGHAAGEVASNKAVEVIRRVIAENADEFARYGARNEDFDLRDKCQALVEGAVQQASAEIFAMAREDETKRGMGTTCVVLVRAGAKAIVGHVGDSRVYLLRSGEAYQITEDHTLVNEQYKQGLITLEEAVSASFSNVITRCVGYQEAVQVDTLLTDLLPGDRFLLCSDGLSEYVRDEEWAEFLGARAVEDLPGKLVDLANHRGGRDNITALVVAVEAPREEDVKAEVEARMDALRRIPLFKHLKYKEMIQVFSIVRTESIEAGQAIIEEGKEGDTLYVLLRGEAEVTKAGTKMAEFSAGQHFGEMALIDNAPRSASIRAITDSTILTIDRDSFYGLMRKDSVLAVKLLWAFLQVLTGRLRATSEDLTGALMAAQERSSSE